MSNRKSFAFLRTGYENLARPMATVTTDPICLAHPQSVSFIQAQLHPVLPFVLKVFWLGNEFIIQIPCTLSLKHSWLDTVMAPVGMLINPL